MTYIIQSSNDSSSESNHRFTQHKIIVSVVDSRSGMDVFDINIDSITTAQFMDLLHHLYTLREHLRMATHGHAHLLEHTITIINAMLAEYEGNDSYAALSINFQQLEINDMEDMLAATHKQTLDINISYWVPDTLQVCPALYNYIEYVGERRLFAVDLSAQPEPRWNTVLTDLRLLA